MFDFTGYGENLLTFRTAATSLSGMPVTVTANGTVSASSDGDSFCGIGRQVRNGGVTVLMSGYAEASYTGATAPALGTAVIAANGSGGVKASETGRTVTVVSLDTTANKIGFIF